ncbi:hypothetical protein CRV24_010346 [Beauveria bassiana]|nr:hypothetical protein CRV24_010346 [Beauveria bassiana]
MPPRPPCCHGYTNNGCLEVALTSHQQASYIRQWNISLTQVLCHIQNHSHSRLALELSPVKVANQVIIECQHLDMLMHVSALVNRVDILDRSGSSRGEAVDVATEI